MRKLTVGLDVDEVLIQLHQPWLDWGNREFGTQYRYFTHWAAPETYWGSRAWDFLTPALYEGPSLQPYPHALLGVDTLRAQGHDIRYVTACSFNKPWLQRYGFLRGDDEYVPLRDKSQAPVDLLVDDGIHNVRDFQGWSILVTRPHNMPEPWLHQRISSVIDLPYLLR